MLNIFAILFNNPSIAAMNKIVIICLLVLSQSINVHSQVSKSQQKAEKEFLSQLNTIIRQKNTLHHWNYELPFTIIQPFQIENNQLSVVLKYSTDSSWFIHKMVIPVESIRDITWDMYAILESGSKNVMVYESLPNSTTIKLVDSRNHFHIALVEDETIIFKLRKGWEKLAAFYGLDYSFE